MVVEPGEGELSSRVSHGLGESGQGIGAANTPRERDVCLVESLRFLSRLGGTLLISYGVLILAGWNLRLGPMYNPAVRRSLTVPNSAFCFLALGVCLLLLREPAATGGRQARVGRWLAIAIAILGLLTFAENLWSVRWGVGEFVLTTILRGGESFAPHMATATALAFVLCSLSLAWLDAPATKFRLAEWLAIVPGLLGLLGVMDNLFEPSVVELRISLPTALMLVVLAGSILLARPADGLMAVISSYSLGGITARRLLPTCVLLLVGLGWLRWKGEEAGLYESQFGVALYAAASIVILAVVVWRVARSLTQAEADREHADAVWFQANEELRRRAERRIAQLEQAIQELRAEQEAKRPASRP